MYPVIGDAGELRFRLQLYSGYGIRPNFNAANICKRPRVCENPKSKISSRKYLRKPIALEAASGISKPN